MKKSEIISLTIATALVFAFIHSLMYGWVQYLIMSAMAITVIIVIISAILSVSDFIHKTLFK